jgi:GxxExxY protein
MRVYDDVNDVTGEIVDAAIRVHSGVGPGLLESAYQVCMEYELSKRGLRIQANVPLPVCYDGVQLNACYRIDLLVEGRVLVELKAVAKLHPLHTAQLLSYLRLSNNRIGLLLNFHECRMKDGIVRLIHTPRPQGSAEAIRIAAAQH